MDTQNKWSKGRTYRQRIANARKDDIISENWTPKDAVEFALGVILIIVIMIGLVYLNHITIAKWY